MKNWVMRRGMGIGGDLPKLARGLPLEYEGVQREAPSRALGGRLETS